MLEPGLLYFAYGCNMDHECLSAVVASELAPGWAARAAGWSVVFNLAEGGGARETVANLVESPGCVSYGVVYRLPQAALQALDEFEGVPEVYRRATVWVEPLGRRARQAVLVYLGQPGCAVADGLPGADYVTTLLRGAQRSGLPDAYVSWLSAAAQGEASGCFTE